MPGLAEDDLQAEVLEVAAHVGSSEFVLVGGLLLLSHEACVGGLHLLVHDADLAPSPCEPVILQQVPEHQAYSHLAVLFAGDQGLQAQQSVPHAPEPRLEEALQLRQGQQTGGVAGVLGHRDALVLALLGVAPQGERPGPASGHKGLWLRVVPRGARKQEACAGAQLVWLGSHYEVEG